MPEAWVLKLRDLLNLTGASEAATRGELQARGSHTGTVVDPDGEIVLDLSQSKTESFEGMAARDSRLMMEPFSALRYTLLPQMADIGERLLEGLDEEDEDEAAIRTLTAAAQAFCKDYNDGFEDVTGYTSVSPTADAAHIERVGDALVGSVKTLEDAMKAAISSLEGDEDFEEIVDGLTDLTKQTSMIQLAFGPLIAYLAEVVRTEAEEDDVEARAAAFFAKYSGGTLDKAIQKLQGRAYASMMEADAQGMDPATSNTMVIGRLADTAPIREELEESGLQDKVLNVKSGWSLAANEAFMKSGLDTKGRFRIATKLAAPTRALLKTKPTSTQLMAFFKAQEDEDEHYGRLTSEQQDIWESHKKEGEPIDPGMWNAKRGPSVTVREIGLLLDDGYHFHENPGEGQMMVPTQARDLLAEIRSAE